LLNFLCELYYVARIHGHQIPRTVLITQNDLYPPGDRYV